MAVLRHWCLWKVRECLLFTVPGIDSGWSIRNVSSPAQEEMMLDTNN